MSLAPPGTPERYQHDLLSRIFLGIALAVILFIIFNWSYVIKHRYLFLLCSKKKKIFRFLFLFVYVYFWCAKRKNYLLKHGNNITSEYVRVFFFVFLFEWVCKYINVTVFIMRFISISDYISFRLMDFMMTGECKQRERRWQN